MQEARFSFNVKFTLGGMESQLTVRAAEDEALGSFRETIQAAVRMVASMGASPRPANGKSGTGENGTGGKSSTGGNGKLQPAPVARRSCPSCGKDDQLELIKFTKYDAEFQKYKCKRCDKWLPSALQPSKEELAIAHEELVKTLWP